MKFDTLIIGGGLAGLTAGIILAKAGQKCAIVSSGQSALHFFSGSLDLLGYLNEQEIDSPFDVIGRLNPLHPYQKIGVDNVRKYADKTVEFFAEIGVAFKGDADRNHYRISPVGALRKTWLTLENHYSNGGREFGKTIILNIEGFLDFHPHFVAEGLARKGVKCDVSAVTVNELQALRTSPTEMRSANIAKTLENRAALIRLIEEINKVAKDYDTVIFPSVFGLYNYELEEYVKNNITSELLLIPTFPPSAPGIRMQMMMKQHFQNLGGVYMLGDTVTNGHISGNKIQYVRTVNHKDIRLEATNFIIASGSFFSHGLQAHPNSICEPIFNLDVNDCDERQTWFDQNVFGTQPYMSFGVKTDSQLHPQIKGDSVSNLFAIGSILEAANSLKEASGAGISITTAMHAAHMITKQ